MHRYLTLAAFLALALPAWGAMQFNGSTEYAMSSTAEVTATPLTLACWVKPTSVAATAVIFLSGNLNAHYFKIHAFAGSLGGVTNPVLAQQGGGAGSNFAQTSTGWTAGTWHSMVAVFASSTSRAAYIDGGSKGTNTTSETPANISATLIAAGRDNLNNITQHSAITVAECGIWNVALTDDDAYSLGKGFAPPCIRRSALVAYYPMVRDATSLKDFFSATANHLTLTGGTVSDHPPIINCQ